ncbi:hypothetical protein L226DRAFT_208380 [Lentinus tigrinus ALCF2SS1-7]|uniref:C2H2-type domain-containing protein n=1 Tax=Lentinus tigrinus ALCF2SS1-6 TaxID=1328759 RepID=A0A5C2RWN4_9APHY|nr:hypothetical protein L227DRAFT_310171 [Lentinus tigrinus ALCF2SS1-6]RPD71375.1 hypothetical protein L226DRAFT_208380 [Lentinus tigrinus ALCF2SS1-7]
MDSQKSPPSLPSTASLTPPDALDADMAAVVAHQPFPAPSTDNRVPPAASSGVGKTRYRPAPAKTFQCRGYGECRMVFSRSEHLARHIRKHTGERPFTCHCGKQFSRLDNLRQHAQTVHADKQDQNERMMQELTSLHATMTAASKGGNGRKRAQGASNPSGVSPTSAASLNGSIPSMAVKQEDGSHAVPPLAIRPGTSTGYEGANALFHPPGSSTWHIQTSDVDRPSVRPTNSHSFRDPGQSFRAPSSSAPSAPGPASLYHQQLQHNSSQSFLVPSAPFNFSLSDISSATRPGSSSGPSASATADPARSLPPLSAVVPPSLPPVRSIPPPPGSLPAPPVQQQQQPLTHSSVLPLPTPSGPYHGRRPSTAARPGTAPAAYYYPPGSAGSGAFPPGPGAISSLGAPRGPELSLRFAIGHGRLGGGLEPIRRLGSGYGGGEDASAGPADEPTSPGGYDSPFSFHAPATGGSASYAAESSAAGSAYAPGASNPRKRPYSGSDDDDGAAGPPRERFGERIGGDARPVTGGGGEYEYGSESRPQSRRLSVMELCNDPPADAAAARPFVPLSGPSGLAGGHGNGGAGAGTGSGSGALSRPTTSSGLVTTTAQLALVDRPSRSPPPSAALAAVADVFARAPPAPAGAAAAAPPPAAARGDGGARTPELGGGVFEAPRGGVRVGEWGAAFGQPASGGAYGRHGVFPASPATAAAGSASPATGHGAFAGGSPGQSQLPRAYGSASPAPSAGGAPGSPLARAHAHAHDAGRGLSPAGGRRAGGSPGHGNAAGPGGESHRDDQVRIPAAVGMRA